MMSLAPSCAFVRIEPHEADQDMEWVCPAYARGVVDRAGATLARESLQDIEADEWEDALAVINNWRSSHSRPLYTFRLGLRRNAEKVDPNALVAQRIKRLSSIRLKLLLCQNMKLSQMQDIGGCRAVVENVSQVRDLVNRYKLSDIKHKLTTEDDYVTRPKLSGYRGVHLVYKYFSDKKQTHNGLRIEVQIRSQLQHAWATSVEIAGTFVRQALKSSQGEEDWLRFFALMGSALSQRERSPLIPGTPDSARTLRKELKACAKKLDVVNRLAAFGTALQIVDQTEKNAAFYLLELDTTAMSINVIGYQHNELEKASADYLNIEKTISAGSGNDAVLVSADSMNELKRAYPNYFLDTHRFLEAVRKAI